MTPQLRALLATVAVLAGGVTIYTLAAGVTPQDVRNTIADSGNGTCTLKDAQCDVYWDGGYRTVLVRAARCPNPDGGPTEWVVSQRVAPFVPDVRMNCRVLATCATCDGGGVDLDSAPDQLPAGTPGCACAQVSQLGDGGFAAGAACTWVADGGQIPLTGSYDSSLVTGPGCLPRVCNESAGNTGAPVGCQP